MTFDMICEKIRLLVNEGWENEDISAGTMLDMQKRAIIGYTKEVGLYTEKIKSLLSENELVPEDGIPPWYSSTEDAVFHEVWGLAGLSEWFLAEYAESSSAKIIGERIYFLGAAGMKLMPQTICPERTEQLIRALLLLSPDERLDKEFHEVYMLDGTRVTIFRGRLTKDGQDSIILRRYIIPDYSFREQADRKTIPEASIGLFEDMVRIGYNVVFCGSVRSAKTTFLSTWQRIEDPALEGVMVETDPEIPLHLIMPNAPVIQLIADHDKLGNIAKNLLRSDADYFVFAEARDGIALDTAVRAARRGTRRMKMTFHCRDPKTFAEDAAVEIVRAVGGSIGDTALRVAGSFDYIFHFVQLKPGNAKKLKAIFEMGISPGGQVSMKEICKYDQASDDWRWTCDIGEEKRSIGLEENAEAFLSFEKRLSALETGFLS